LTDIMMAREFVPNTPCLVNAGKAQRPARRPVSCSTCRTRLPAS
jgi:ribonucleotide reductase alpha subunit